ncbi:hypothetical protein G6F46_010588 [Rhizopus delemar]|nr:hypothetical protein G6F46_010588 [Rhizopus delemar]KAG1631356.1 hypothetical protein G6F44_011051 [Rhizopus delemar]
MPHLKTTHKEDATISLELDPSFTGIMRGIAHDESEGCTVSGNCIVMVHKPIKIRRFIVWLEGRCKVTLKGTGYSVSNTEGTESRTLYSKDIHFFGDDGLTHTLLPGQYAYPFRFDLPANLPASFRGKRGYVRYRLQAAIYRPMFASDIQVSRDVSIKRCLMNDGTHLGDLRETYEGTQHTNKLRYSATAPSITYREGGLIRLNIEMQLTRPETQSVRTVTCALRERIQYRTTDSNANTILSKTDNLFPLGYSTFYPSQEPGYNPREKADYNALFRLCPRVNADLNSRLMKLTHALVVNIMIEDTVRDEDEESAYETEATDTEWCSEDERQIDTKHSSPSSTPPNSAPPSAPGSPILSRSSSASSITSIFSLGRSHGSGYASGGEELASIPAIKNHRRRPKKQKEPSHGPYLTLCTLEVPLVVTSREHTWDEKHNPPSYDDAQQPPSYYTALDDLPRAPTYQTGEVSGRSSTSNDDHSDECQPEPTVQPESSTQSNPSTSRPSLISRSSFHEATNAATHAAAKMFSAVSSKVPRSNL